jgi:hypothetical protein
MSFLRRAFEQRDLTSFSPTMAAMGLTVPSNGELAPTSAGVAGQRHEPRSA